MTQIRQAVVAPRTQADRRVGVDLARGVAILCMVIAHVKHWARPPEGSVAALVTGQLNNLASPLFGLVMGVALGIVMVRSPMRPGDGRTLVIQNLVRGVLLIALGIALVQLQTFVAIVLQSLGVTLVVGTPIALLGVRMIAAISAVLFAVGPWINALARASIPVERAWASDGGSQVLQWVVLGTSYRLTNLLPLFLAGVVAARLGLTRRVVLGLLAMGLPAYLVTAVMRFSADGMVVTGSVLDNFSDLGLAFTALALCLLAARVTTLRPLLAPVAAIGTVALSVYVLHVVLIAVVIRTWGTRAYVDWPVAAGFVLGVTVLVAWAWWRWVGKGPIEVVLGMVSGRYRLR